MSDTHPVNDPRPGYFRSAMEGMAMVRKINDHEEPLWWANLGIALYNATMAAVPNEVAQQFIDQLAAESAERQRIQEFIQDSISQQMMTPEEIQDQLGIDIAEARR